MSDAYIYDAVRTPRGRGKVDGSLHEVSTLGLAVTALSAIKARNKLKGLEVDDVILGCVDPVGEAGGDIARASALAAGFGDSVPGVQINRFCASGLDAVNFAAAQVMSGQHDLAIGGGVESMSRVGIGASGGAWPVDPAIAIPVSYTHLDVYKRQAWICVGGGGHFFLAAAGGRVDDVLGQRQFLVRGHIKAKGER